MDVATIPGVAYNKWQSKGKLAVSKVFSTTARPSKTKVIPIVLKKLD